MRSLCLKLKRKHNLIPRSCVWGALDVEWLSIRSSTSYISSADILSESNTTTNPVCRRRFTRDQEGCQASDSTSPLANLSSSTLLPTTRLITPRQGAVSQRSWRRWLLARVLSLLQPLARRERDVLNYLIRGLPKRPRRLTSHDFQQTPRTGLFKGYNLLLKSYIFLLLFLGCFQ